MKMPTPNHLYLYFLFLILLPSTLLLPGCDDFTYKVEKFFGLPTGVHNHIDLFIDVTASREWKEELAQDSLFIVSLISKLGESDLLEIYFVHARTFSKAERVFEVKMPDKPGTRGRKLKEARQQMANAFSRIWPREITDAIKRGFHKQTDLTGVFRFINAHSATGVQHSVILVSDMLAVEPGHWNFERTPPKTDLLQTWQEQGLLPDLTGVGCYVFGAYARPGISNDHYLAVRDFWEAFFRKSGAELKAYQYQRDTRLIFPD